MNTLDPQEPNLDVLQQEPEPWGFWATLGFGLLAFVLFTAAQTIVGILYGFTNLVFVQDVNPEVFFEGIEYDGLFLALAGILATPVLLGYLFVFCALRRGLPIKEYLGLKRTSRAKLFVWGVIVAAYFVEADYFADFFQITDASGAEFMFQIRDTARVPILLWFAVIICAPIGEELLFRGFLYKGFRHSPAGVGGAIMLTAFLWAVIHTQYEWFGITLIFGFGVILGLARERTNSVYTTIVLHMAWNLVATIQSEFYYRAMGN